MYGVPGITGITLELPVAHRPETPTPIQNDASLCDRDLRNTLEHFDERLDEYLLRDLAGYFFPAPMVGSSDMADEAIGHLFRLVDPEKEIFVLFGKRFPFGALRETVAIIYHSAQESSNFGRRLSGGL